MKHQLEEGIEQGVGNRTSTRRSWRKRGIGVENEKGKL